MLAPESMFGPYRILARLGAGGMGEVYRARDTRLGREVAIKILPASMVGDTERRQRFVQEAQAASQLNHPHIVTIYDIGEHDGVQYIAMELVGGRPLDELIPKSGMRLSEALKHAIAIADALARAHAAGIIHRDLKPSNVMIREDGVAKLLDFGIAKLTEPLHLDESGATRTSSGPRTAEGSIVGTVSYMSPEQAEGQELDSRSDIFSFGTLLYEMLSGRRAFDGGSAVSTLSAVLRDEPRPIRDLAGDVPPELERVIARCLRKDRERRWQSMTDLKVALAELKEETDSGILLAGTRTAIRPAVSRRRRPVAAIVLASLLGAVVLGGVGWWFLLRRPGAAVPPSVGSSLQPPEIPVPGAVPPAAPLTNDDVIAMVRAGINPQMILKQLRSSRTAFDLSTAELIRLANADVPEAVIDAMRGPAPAAPSRAAADATLSINDGQPVTLILAQDLDGSVLKAGAAVQFTVAENVKAGDGVAIRKGAPASGTVLSVERKKFFRKRPRMLLQLDRVTTVDGQQLGLRASRTRSGKKDALEVAGPIAAEGTRYDAYLDQSATVRPSPSR